MPTKATWVSAQEAAQILTANTDHVISADYVFLLAKKKKKIAYRAVDGRTNEYNRRDCERYIVRRRDTPRVRPRPSTRKEKPLHSSS